MECWGLHACVTHPMLPILCVTHPMCHPSRVSPTPRHPSHVTHPVSPIPCYPSCVLPTPCVTHSTHHPPVVPQWKTLRTVASTRAGHRFTQTTPSPLEGARQALRGVLWSHGLQAESSGPRLPSRTRVRMTAGSSYGPPRGSNPLKPPGGQLHVTRHGMEVGGDQTPSPHSCASASISELGKQESAIILALTSCS